jgi:hypothetical protein
VVLAACDGDSEPTSIATTPEASASSSEIPTTEPTPTVEVECADQQAAIPDEDALLPGSIPGDFDGDGSEEEALIYLFEDAQPDCRAILAIQSDVSTYSIPVWRLGGEGGLEQPSLYAKVEINSLPGLEVLVNEAQGASTQFVGAYTIVEGELQMISEAGGGQFGGLFAYGGSVGHLEAVDCVGSQGLVVTVATPAPGRKAQNEGIYEFERRFYRVEEAELIPVETEHQRAKFDVGVVPEFGIGPFASCA